MRVTILTGQSSLLDGRIASGINKQPLTEPQFCDIEGLMADVQVARSVHGGPERALHYYPKEHYAFWKMWFHGMGLTAPLALLTAGGFGENISGERLVESQACIGDIYQLDEALVQISQPRSPCYKLNARFGYEAFSVLVQANGRVGWLLRVLETGLLNPQADMTLVSRPHPQMSVQRAADIMFNRAFNAADVQELAQLASLSPSWRKKAEDYLREGQVASWHRRLLGPV